MQPLETGLVAGPQRKAALVEPRSSGNVLPRGGDRREHDARPPGRQVGEKRCARASLGWALERAGSFVARTQECDEIAFAQIVLQVGKGSLRGIGRGNDHEQRSAERTRQNADDCRARRRDRFVKRACAGLSSRQLPQRADSFDRAAQRAALRERIEYLSGHEGRTLYRLGNGKSCSSGNAARSPSSEASAGGGTATASGT